MNDNKLILEAKGILDAPLDRETDSVIRKLIIALEAAEQRIATMTESYNSIGKINAAQALEIRELKMKLWESTK